MKTVPDPFKSSLIFPSSLHTRISPRVHEKTGLAPSTTIALRYWYLLPALQEYSYSNRPCIVACYSKFSTVSYIQHYFANEARMLQEGP
eukprot:3454737-Rhodomonas_salina.2